MGFNALVHRIKSLVPQPVLRRYHWMLARISAVCYGHPSRELIVIGVTGTNGKTTTSYLLAKALEASGYPTGCTTTAVMKTGDREWLNRSKMTMQGRFFLQKTLREMVRAGCRYAVIETSSQGILQSRHIGIEYDVAVFTNLTPEHLEAHGGFESYKEAKGWLFASLQGKPNKVIGGETIKKSIVLNADSPHAAYYADRSGIDRIMWYSLRGVRGVVPEHVEYAANGSSCTIEGVPVKVQMPGAYNLENVLAVFAVCKALRVDLASVAKVIETVQGVPGRFERVSLGQPWTVVIDYAYEPVGLEKTYEAIRLVPHKRMIHVLGSCGGGRDSDRRSVLGRMAGTHADVVIVTNEDPYDDDPQGIISQVADGAKAVGKREGETLYMILDRAEAIQKAMNIAEKDDLVLLTGKGCEPWICVANGEKLAWSERGVAEQAIRRKMSGQGGADQSLAT